MYTTIETTKPGHVTEAHNEEQRRFAKLMNVDAVCMVAAQRITHLMELADEHHMHHRHSLPCVGCVMASVADRIKEIVMNGDFHPEPAPCAMEIANSVMGMDPFEQLVMVTVPPEAMASQEAFMKFLHKKLEELE